MVQTRRVSVRTRTLVSPSLQRALCFSLSACCGIVPQNREPQALNAKGGFSMDDRATLSRRKLLHYLAATGVIAAADLAWWDEPLISPRKAWGATPVRF